MVSILSLGKTECPMQSSGKRITDSQYVFSKQADNNRAMMGQNDLQLNFEDGTEDDPRRRATEKTPEWACAYASFSIHASGTVFRDRGGGGGFTI